MIRLIGATARAFLVLVLIVAPAFLLPGASQNVREFSILFGVLGAAFALFEYGGSYPGLIDFRFAPPYNRGRFLTLAMVVLGVVFLCRATLNADTFSADLLGVADWLAAGLDLPGSPVRLAAAHLTAEGATEEAALLRRAAALSLTLSVLGLTFFVLLIWVFSWPQGREKFNLWINLPTFTPASGREVERRLIWGGAANVAAGLVLPYLLILLAVQAGDLVQPIPLGSHIALVWGMVVWSFVPAALVVRGAALIKVGWLVKRARRF